VLGIFSSNNKGDIVVGFVMRYVGRGAVVVCIKQQVPIKKVIISSNAKNTDFLIILTIVFIFAFCRMIYSFPRMIHKNIYL
jgi:hypothetical protein